MRDYIGMLLWSHVFYITSIEDMENNPTHCDLNREPTFVSSDLINKGQTSKTNSLLLDREVQQKETSDAEELGLQKSFDKSIILQRDKTCNDGLADQKTICRKPAIEHTIPQDVGRVLENKIIESSSGLQFVNVSVVEMTLSNSDSNSENIVSKTITSNSDLISGVYEGGMKIWECTFDLMKYLEEEDVVFKGKRVLDLGCGAGLLGIVALKRKAKEVHFQDYNSTVIEEITIPNILVNCDSDDVNENIEEKPSGKRYKKSGMKAGLLFSCRFFSGDWSHFRILMQNEMPPMQYDIILTSETIYNPSYYSALHDIFQHLLAPNGIVYLTSKSHYFGVGGGVHLFETFIKEGKLFHINTLNIHEDGLQRMLLSLSFKDHL
ncbi:histidine protein methyltransferase 1 homolog isoform X2 [Pseudophryne corroboree]|uniref:histidine protein methyltransferase 1 homolog isoform X2 n=1 Tax=Pseudophryne corroboree TaxID=495146 RepID=UPI003081313B